MRGPLVHRTETSIEPCPLIETSKLQRSGIFSFALFCADGQRAHAGQGQLTRRVECRASLSHSISCQSDFRLQYVFTCC